MNDYRVRLVSQREEDAAKIAAETPQEAIAVWARVSPNAMERPGLDDFDLYLVVARGEEACRFRLHVHVTRTLKLEECP